jgi:small-conductance mechanosensitive channel
MDIAFAGIQDLRDPLIAIGIFLSSLIVALLFYRTVYHFFIRILPGVPSDPDSTMVSALRMPLTLMIIGLGALLTVTLPLQISGRPLAFGLTMLSIVLGAVGISSILTSIITRFIDGFVPKDKSAAHTRLVPIFRRLTMIFVYILGGLLVLDLLEINITPLVAGLGIGGLAVGLAIQPTLANLFAGTYVMTEGVINPGDFVEMENGLAGYVVDVSWRSTRIRSIENNLVLVPNAKFSDSIVTNYHQPEEPVGFFVRCGVSFESNLYQVERVCVEVIDHVMDTDSNAAIDSPRRFGFEEFGESNVNFFLYVRAKDRISRIFLRTALMQRLRERFREEGIVINYPVRSLRFPDGVAPGILPDKIAGAHAVGQGPSTGVSGANLTQL